MKNETQDRLISSEDLNGQEMVLHAQATADLNLPFPTLTDREREIALLLARGDINREIAKALGISIKTVDTHRGHILKKLGLRHNVDLARYALRMGYVTLGEVAEA